MPQKKLQIPNFWPLAKIIFFTFFFISFYSSATAQTITGTVSSMASGETIAGATVTNAKKNNSVVTNAAGMFTIAASAGDKLTISYIGHNNFELSVGTDTDYKIVLQQNNNQLEGIKVIGSRGKPRTDITRPVPVDVVSEKEMKNSGVPDITQSLNVLVPSFNSARQTISNGTDHIDPATLRGLGPDQTLMLVNGKRRYSSALVNVNSTVGRGSVGTDLNAIPASAIERIEVLRDGAAAQYGSDAIAGIINIVLKRKVKQLEITSAAGRTKEGDGESMQLGANYGLPLGKNGGFINLTADYRKRTPANRVGVYTNTVYQSLLPQTRYPGLPNYVPLTAAQLEIQRKDDSTVRNRNFDKSNTMILGNSLSENMGVFANIEYPINSRIKLYGNFGYNHRNGKAGGFFRFPNNPRTSNITLYPNGYLPFILTDIDDKSGTVGISSILGKDWNMDLSTVYGGNTIDFSVENSLNASMGNASPLNFYCGKLQFNQSTTDVVFTKDFGRLKNLRSLNISFGAEFRTDFYKISKGDEASYIDANPAGTPAASVKASGVQVFGGFRPSNEVDENRNNVGVFVDVESDITEKLLIATALRYEHYSDFGSNLSGKLVARYKITDYISLRAGVNRGFRAPSLHQKYFSSVSTQFITVGGVNQQKEVLTVNNSSPIVSTFGIPALKPELSWNYSAGITAGKGSFILSIDGYIIDIKDRIVVSGRFSNTNPQVATLLSAFPQVSDVQFFTNAIDTRTYGLDIVGTKKIRLSSKNELAFNLAANFNQTDIKGDSAGVKTSPQLAGLGETLFNREERGRIEVNQPKNKIIFSSNLKIADLFNFNLRFTRYGEISTIAPQDPFQDQTFSAKTLTDIMGTWNISKKVYWNMGVNNLFDVYPDKVKDARLTNDGAVQYSRFATQFGFNGMYFFTGLNIKI